MLSTFLEEGAAGAAAAWVGVCGGAAEHRPDVILLVGVAEIVVVVVVVDALPVLALPAAVPSQAPQLLLPQQLQCFRRLVRQVALSWYHP
jgi:phosphoenolpyruvate-protein kinase (PTS system EI component)